MGERNGAAADLFTDLRDPALAHIGADLVEALHGCLVGLDFLDAELAEGRPVLLLEIIGVGDLPSMKASRTAWSIASQRSVWTKTPMAKAESGMR